MSPLAEGWKKGPSMRARLGGLVALAALVACGPPRVDSSVVARLPLEEKLDLLEAENDLFIAVDALDEARDAALAARDDYRKSGRRITEAKEALAQAKKNADERRVEVGELAVEEARLRRTWLDASVDLSWLRLEVAKARLELARRHLERIRAQAVKKANLPGSEKVVLAKFDAAVADGETRFRAAADEEKRVQVQGEQLRVRWNEARQALARKTGGAQGSPWVQ